MKRSSLFIKAAKQSGSGSLVKWKNLSAVVTAKHVIVDGSKCLDVNITNSNMGSIAIKQWYASPSLDVAVGVIDESITVVDKNDLLHIATDPIHVGQQLWGHRLEEGGVVTSVHGHVVETASRHFVRTTVGGMPKFFRHGLRCCSEHMYPELSLLTSTVLGSHNFAFAIHRGSLRAEYSSRIESDEEAGTEEAESALDSSERICTSGLASMGSVAVFVNRCLDRVKDAGSGRSIFQIFPNDIDVQEACKNAFSGFKPSKCIETIQLGLQRRHNAQSKMTLSKVSEFCAEEWIASRFATLKTRNPSERKYFSKIVDTCVFQKS